MEGLRRICTANTYQKADVALSKIQRSNQLQCVLHKPFLLTIRTLKLQDGTCTFALRPKAAGKMVASWLVVRGEAAFERVCNGRSRPVVLLGSQS